MTDSFHPLKIAVERIVRPIRASNFRKVKMREELFAHLVDSINEEGGDETDAAVIERRLTRLGPPEDLRSELQGTVPKLERFLCFPLDGGKKWTWFMNFRLPRKRESGVKYAFRMAGFQTLLFSLWAAAFFGWRSLTGQAPLLVSILTLVGLSVSIFFILFCAILSGRAGALYLWGRNERSHLMAVLVLSLVFLGILSFGLTIEFALRVSHIMELDDADLSGYAILSLVATFLLPVIYQLDRIDLRRWEEWKSLDIA